MSEENAEVVRQPIAVRAHTRRRLEERLALRFPRLLSLIARAIWRLPPRSRLRQAVLRRALRLGLEASNRGDYEATFMLYHPECESSAPPELGTVGFQAEIRGREERIRWEGRWRSEWGDFRYEPEELIDLGDRHVVIGRVRGSGEGSGVAVDSDWGLIFTSSDGKVIREEVWFDRRAALEAAGLSE